MSRVRMRRPQAAVPAVPVNEKQIRQQLGQAVGAEFFQNRDPLYHITESFQMTFDAMGRRHAEELAKAEPQQRDAQGETAQPQADAQTQEQMPDKTSTRSFYDRSNPEEQEMLKRFSELGFQRGTLSGAVLRGSGQMMLFSCLKKTVGQSQPNRWQQRKLFEKVSPHRNSAGRNPDKVIFNRGFTDSAVGLVVDTLRDARRVVEHMQALAKGGLSAEAGSFGGAETLQKMYPFLDDSQERQLLAQYQEQLAQLEDGDPKRSILHNALTRTHALVAKKAQMRDLFINRLRFISDRATEALEVFSRPEFAEQIHEALLRDLVPADGSDEDGTDAADAAENGTEAGTDA